MATEENVQERRRALELARLEVEEEEIRIKRLKLQQERGRIETLGTDQNDIVELNVGGRSFATSRETLLLGQSPYFARLLVDSDTQDNDSTPFLSGARRDRDGRFFIDRCPDLFAQVLEYLRGSLDLSPLTHQQKLRLRSEAVYYQIQGLIDELPRPPPSYDEGALSEDDIRIRREAQSIRAALDKGDPGAPVRANSLLTNFFSAGTPGRKLALAEIFESPPTSPGLPLLFESYRDEGDPLVTPEAREPPDRLTPEAREPPEDIGEFKRRLVSFGGPLMQGLNMANLVVAGGAVQMALTVDCSTQRSSCMLKSDIDLFIVADDDSKALEVYNRVLSHIQNYAQRQGSKKSLLVVRSKFAVTFCIGYPQRHLQLMLRRHSCIADVIFGFDVDCAQVAYDGETVWATPSAKRAFLTGINIADPERSSDDYEMRLAKFARRGFLVSVPGLELDLIRPSYHNGVFTLEDGNLKAVELSFTPGEEKPSLKVCPEPIVGLAKLVVLSALTLRKSSSYYEAMEERDAGGFESDRDEVFLTTGVQRPKRRENFLVSAERFRKDYEHIVWKKPTPPIFPPTLVTQGLDEPGFLDSAGGPLLPYYHTYENAEKLRRRLIELDRSESQRSPWICYDFIGNARSEISTPNVTDARNQYPFGCFGHEKGKLPQHLEFPPSTGQGTNPWLRLPGEAWIGDAYNAD